MLSRHILITLLAVLALASTRAEADEPAKLNAFFKEYLEQLFRQRPMTATGLGDHRFDDKLDDLSAQARHFWTDYQRQTLKQLPKRVDYDKLPRPAQIDFEILQHHLKRNIWLADHSKVYEQDPRTYTSYITNCVYQLLTQSTLPQTTNIKNAMARMAQVPKVVAAARSNLKNPPKVYVETAIRQNRGAIRFYQSGIFEVVGKTKLRAELEKACKALVPVLKKYGDFLEDELLPRAKGEWRIGKEKFAEKLVLTLDAGMTADEVLQEAQAEFERVQREMYVMARQLWSQTVGKSGAPLPPDDAKGRRSATRQVLDHLAKKHGKPEELVRDAKASVDRIKKFIESRDILRLPKPDRCQIIEMPEFQRGNSTAFLNSAPPLDRKAVSIYAISPPPKSWDAGRVTSFLEEYNSYMLQILTIHEAYPGHYVQLEYSNRYPSLIRRILTSGIFAEGWAVYTEQMMLDEGYGDGDPAMRLHQLKWYLRAVTNAILDHKMHCTRMTDKEAYQLLTDGAYQSEGEAVGKIIRSKQSSCQLSTYFVGRTAFYRLRQQVQRKQGKEFELGRFHEAVLDHGTLPVKYLPEVVPVRLKKPR